MSGLIAAKVQFHKMIKVDFIPPQIGYNALTYYLL